MGLDLGSGPSPAALGDEATHLVEATEAQEPVLGFQDPALAWVGNDARSPGELTIPVVPAMMGLESLYECWHNHDNY